MASFSTYYRLTKPGIIYGNALTAAGGFLLGAEGHPHPGLLLSMLVGISLVMASGCVVNNYLDREIDAKMARTKTRALVIGSISDRNALIYAAILGATGIILLLVLTNPLTAAVALFGWVAYVVIYGIGKRRSIHGTVIGSISGATPPVIGYTAVTNHLDLAAALLFIILVLWQMPHFYAIAIFRRDEYATAGIPTLPVRRGITAAKHQIIGYTIAFGVAASSLTLFGVTGYVYFIAMSAVTVLWLRVVLQGLRSTDDVKWARAVFGFSLIVLTTFSASIAVTALVP